MFLKDQNDEQVKEYERFLKLCGSLSNLFSDSSVPYLYYRVAEKVFCKAFNAEDLSRSDVSFDAKKNNLGIGLKTFLAGNNKTMQKVAEFNRDGALYEGLPPEDLIRRVSELRNTRIDFTENAYGINDSIYHCVLRDHEKFLIFEEPMEKIDLDNITDVKVNNNSISFTDGRNDYSFLIRKSTLTKRFVTEPIVYDFEVKILKNPLEELAQMFEQNEVSLSPDNKFDSTVYLPLYGTRTGKVEEKSGLNQWNAGGRKRDINEVYIPVPAEVHDKYPDFFPDRNTPFTLRLPDGHEMQAKICQEGGKALMSYSNKELGEWILRSVLKLEEGELFTTEKMREIGIDSVRIDKASDSVYEMNFAKIGSYSVFISR